MATTRIKDLTTTVTTVANDDYVAVDGLTNGTRKKLANSLVTLTDTQTLSNKQTSDAFTVGGNLTVSGTGPHTLAGPVVSTGSTSAVGANKAVLDYTAGTTTRLVSYGPNASTPGAFQIVGLSSNASAGDIRVSISDAGNTTLAGNLTVSGGTSTLVGAPGVFKVQTGASSPAEWLSLFAAGSTNPAVFWNSGAALRLGPSTSETGGGFSQAMSIDAAGVTVGGNLTVSGTQNKFGVPASADALSTNSTMTFELTSNTQLKIKVRGSDGTTREVALTLA